MKKKKNQDEELGLKVSPESGGKSSHETEQKEAAETADQKKAARIRI